MPSRKADPFHWDGLVRLTHWGVAAVCIGNLWLNEAGEEWHEWLGYGAMALIGLPWYRVMMELDLKDIEISQKQAKRIFYQFKKDIEPFILHCLN